MKLIRLIGGSALVAGIIFSAADVRAGSPVAGDKAPSFLPERWVNQSEPVPASAFQGHVVLVERWATWCGPCVASIPQMNELADKYGKKGLIIVGITLEPAEKVKPFVERKGVRYMIGSGGASGFVTRGIPNAWLISPAGRVVWEGYPADLKDEVIQEQLKSVVLRPQFELPAAMSETQRALNGGQFGNGLRLLDKHVNGGDRELAGIARKTVEKVLSYGRERLREVENLLTRSDYGRASRVLRDLMASFSGTEIADRARTRDAALRQDPRIGVEFEGEDMLARADELVAQNRSRQAAALTQQVATSGKFEKTKVREKAQHLLTLSGQAAAE